jgi:hypothetical protein
MKKLPLLVIVFSSLLFSCTKDKIEIDPHNLLIGVWNYSNNKNNAIVYSRNTEFSDNLGYKFRSDGSLLERNISGFCATPPVSYSDYPGTWTILNDTLIRVDVSYSRGSSAYNLDIKSVTSDSLKVLTISINK